MVVDSSIPWSRGRSQAKEELLLCWKPVDCNEYKVRKRKVNLGTWMHHATKLCHMIDYVVMVPVSICFVDQRRKLRVRP